MRKYLTIEGAIVAYATKLVATWYEDHAYHECGEECHTINDLKSIDREDLAAVADLMMDPPDTIEEWYVRYDVVSRLIEAIDEEYVLWTMEGPW